MPEGGLPSPENPRCCLLNFGRAPPRFPGHFREPHPPWGLIFKLGGREAAFQRALSSRWVSKKDRTRHYPGGPKCRATTPEGPSVATFPGSRGRLPACPLSPCPLERPLSGVPSLPGRFREPYPSGGLVFKLGGREAAFQRALSSRWVSKRGAAPCPGGPKCGHLSRVERPPSSVPSLPVVVSTGPPPGYPAAFTR